MGVEQDASRVGVVRCYMLDLCYMHVHCSDSLSQKHRRQRCADHSAISLIVAMLPHCQIHDAPRHTRKARDSQLRGGLRCRTGHRGVAG